MPGVLIVEAMAQCSAVLILREIADRDEKLFLFGIGSMRDPAELSARVLEGLRRLSPAVGSPDPLESVVDTNEPAKSAGSKPPGGSAPATGAGVAAAGSAVAPGSAADPAGATVGPPVASVRTGSADWALAGAAPQAIERATATASRTGLGFTIVTPG